MALNAATVWEVRTTGNANNGGGWNDAGGASVDYSQQDVAELTLNDVVTDGTTTVTSTTGGFTDAMVGSIANIPTKGYREITARTNTNTITVDANVTAGDPLDIYVGGATDDPQLIASSVRPGNVVYIKAGTYTPVTTVGFANGSAISPLLVLSYNASRGDAPDGTDRPVIVDQAVSFGAYSLMVGVRVEGDTNCIILGTGCNARNCKAIMTAAFGAHYCFRAGTGSVVEDCEATDAGNGATTNGLEENGTNMRIIRSHFHDLARGIYLASNASGAMILSNIISDCTIYGISVDGDNITIDHNTIDGNDIGVYKAGTHYGTVMFNNQITNNTTKGAEWQNSERNDIVGANNWYGNGGGAGDDVVIVAKGDGATADDPGYANANAENFSEVNDDNGKAMELGVT